MLNATYLSRKWLIMALLFCLLALIGWGGYPGQTAVASPDNAPSVITVNTHTLSLTEAGDPNDGKCDLREALKAAFDAANTGQAATFNECAAGSATVAIVFDAATAGKTITMPAGGTILPFIKGNVTITGPITLAGSGVVSPPGDNSDSRLLRVASGGTLNLVNLAVANGFTSGGGGAILGDNGSTINTAGVSFTNNVAYSDGGAINSSGTVNILATNFSGNQARGLTPANANNPNTGHGGAIYISGPGSLNIALSNLSGNTADKNGGALFINQGTSVTISDSNFAANVATGNGGENPAGGGALFNKAGSVSMIRSTFNANLSGNGYGGAIFNQLNAGSFTIADSSFNANVVQKNSDNNGYGGAIYSEEDMSVTRSTFNANVVQANNGRGGAIANNRAAVLRVSNSTFLANVVTEFGGVNPAGAGGAIANYDSPHPVSSESTVELRNVTLYLNKAADDAGLFNANGEAIKLWNTILDHGVNAAPLCSGAAPQNMGNNIQSNGTSCGAGIQTADPKLKSPDFNGGAISSLLSLMPKPDSPAVDAGNSAVCASSYVNNEDQRAKSRPKDGNGDQVKQCDIGAVEADTAKVGFASDPIAPGPIDFGLATMGQPSSRSLTIMETGNLPLTVSGALSGPNAGDFEIVGTNPLVLNDGDDPYVWAIGCAPTSNTAGQRTATLTLTTNDPTKAVVNFDLVCTVPPAPTPSFVSDPVAPGPVDFGEVAWGNSLTQFVILGNGGTADMAVSNLSISGANAGEFSVESLPNPFNIPANNSHSLQVTCAPTGAGLRLAQLNLSTNDPANPSKTYNLVCMAIVAPPPFLHTPGTAVPGHQPPDNNGGAFGITVSPDGRHAYMTDFADDRLSLFRVTETGSLALVANYKNGVSGVQGMAQPRSIAISPDGQNLYVTAGNAVVAFSRDSQTGILTYMHHIQEGSGYGCFPGPCAGFIDGLEEAYELTVSPDGKHLYVTARVDGSIVILNRWQDGSIRNVLTGAHVIAIIKDAYLEGARGLTLSPDGQHLYVASGGAHLLLAYARNSQNGLLTYVDGHSGANQLQGANRVLVSHDGRFVYVTALSSNSLGVFARNAFSGALDPQHIYLNGVDVDGLNYPAGMGMSADGKYLYVASYLSDTLTVFYRSTQSGLLYTVQTATQPELDGALGVAVGGDGRTVYVAPYNTSAALVLLPSNPVPAINALLPASVPAGGPAFQLTVIGQNFIPATQAKLNGMNRPTTFVSDSELRVTVYDFDTPVHPDATQVGISVHNPGPGGGAVVRDLIVHQTPNANPVPAIAQLVPQSMPVGGGDLTMTIQGTGFIPGSQVKWNGANLPTTYVSGAELKAAVSGSLMLQVGTAVISVHNPGPGGGASNNAGFDLVAANVNPSPTLTGLTPNHTLARGPGGKQVVVTVYGLNFHEDAQAQWNGFDRPTTVVSGTELRLTLTAADIATHGSGSVRVLNPEPGGGASNTLPFTIYQYGLFLPLTIR